MSRRMEPGALVASLPRRRAVATAAAAAAAIGLAGSGGVAARKGATRRMLARLGAVSVTPVAGSPRVVEVVAVGASRHVHLSPMAKAGAPTSVGHARLMRRLAAKGMLGRDEDRAPVVLFSGRNAETGQEEVHTLRLLNGRHDPETGHLRLRMTAITPRDLTRDDGEACDGWCNPVDYTEGAAEAACEVLGSFGGE